MGVMTRKKIRRFKRWGSKRTRVGPDLVLLRDLEEGDCWDGGIDYGMVLKPSRNGGVWVVIEHKNGRHQKNPLRFSLAEYSPYVYVRPIDSNPVTDSDEGREFVARCHALL